MFAYLSKKVSGLVGHLDAEAIVLCTAILIVFSFDLSNLCIFSNK